MILVFQILLEFVVWTLRLRVSWFRHWTYGNSFYFSMVVLDAAVWVVTAAYFARTETWRAFREGFGLKRGTSNYVWLGISVAIVLRIILYALERLYLGPVVSTTPSARFSLAPNVDRLLFLAPQLLAPFFEEMVMRGFLYKAFRGSFSVWLSVTLVVVIAVLAHWDHYHGPASWLPALGVVSMNVLLCLLREKSDSLWDCIWCHLTFNASTLLMSETFRDLVRS
jgi:membrane protease YdiL (CAAX protease family)